MFTSRLKFIPLAAFTLLWTSPAESATSPAPSAKAAPTDRQEMCSLLTHEEIEKLIDSRIVSDKSSRSLNGNLRVLQCVYVAEPADKSVSLVFTQRDPTLPGTQTAADFWRKAFGHALRDEDEREGAKKEGEEEDEKGRPPRLVADVGEQAFWTAGSLYVLRGEMFVRVSLGGSTAEEKKLKQSIKLARLLLQRLAQRG